MFDDVIQEAIDQTMRELAKPPKNQTQVSRNWQDPEGYRFLFPWSNAVLLRFFIREFTETLPKSEYRRKAQVDDAIRSVVRNIEEGFKRATTGEYLQFLGYSQGSLEEVKGDVRESTEDGFLKSVPGSGLEKIGINLRDLNLALQNPNKLGDVRGELEETRGKSHPVTPLPGKIPSENLPGYHPLSSPNHPLPSKIPQNFTGLTSVSLGGVRGSLEEGKGKYPVRAQSFPYHPLPSFNNPLTPTKLGGKSEATMFAYRPPVPTPTTSQFAYHPITILYPPLASVKPADLTYEIFLELINKTDFLLRQLVISLENKLNADSKGYQIDQIRLQQKTKINR